MRKIALILALALGLVTGVVLSSAFALGLFPLLSNDTCVAAKDGITHPPTLLARLPVLVRKS